MILLRIEFISFFLFKTFFYGQHQRKGCRCRVKVYTGKSVYCRGKCIWLKEEGASVYSMEEIGYFLLDEGIRLPLRAPVEGTISSILVHVRFFSLSNVGR